jgi:hypothetical protein
VKPTKVKLEISTKVKLQAPAHRHPASFKPEQDLGHPLYLIFAREEMGGPNNMGQPHAIANYHKKEKKP